MFEYLKDKYVLNPFYKKLEFLHTIFKLTPNNITLIAYPNKCQKKIDNLHFAKLSSKLKHTNTL